MSEYVSNSVPEYVPIPSVDVFLGLLTLACFLVGVPGNLLATIYFVQEHLNNTRNTKKLFFTELYISMTTVDLVLTITLFPLFENYFSGREGYLFHRPWFCTLWGLIWEIVPCISVFLVGILSSSRMLILLKPMQTLSLRVLRGVVGSYAVYHVLIRSVLWFADGEVLSNKIYYTKTTGYCYFYPSNDLPWVINGYHASVVLGLPVVPISISFMTSLLKLRSSSNAVQTFSRVAQNQATNTIIIVTSVYLVCNLPVFLNYAYYSYIIGIDDDDFTHYYATYRGVFMGNYIWNISYCVLVALNACINPVVFFFRMKPFREFILAFLPLRKRFSKKTSHSPGTNVKEVVTTSSF